MEAEKGELQAPQHSKTTSGDNETEMTGARKRAREALTGSEPTTPSADDDTASLSLPTKRNKLQSQPTPPELLTREGSITPPEDNEQAAGSASAYSETNKVKAIREQVQGLSTAEREARRAASSTTAGVPPSETPSEAGSDQAMTPVMKAQDMAEEEAGNRSLADIGDGDDMHLGESAATTAAHSDGMDPHAALQTPAKPSSNNFMSTVSPASAIKSAITSSLAEPSSALPALSRPNLAALQRSEDVLRPSSPASSIMAETGSIAPNSRRASYETKSNLAEEDVGSERGASPMPSGAMAPHPTPASTSTSLPATSAPTSLFSPGAVNRSLEEPAPASMGTSSAAPSGRVVPASPFAAASGTSGFAKAKPLNSFSSFSSASPFAKASSSSTTTPASPFAAVNKAASPFANASTASPFAAASSKPAPPPKEELDESKKALFVEQDSVTGEEGEESLFSARAKLFVVEGEGYKENGIGILRLNRDIESSKGTTRLLMRAVATHRLILNAVIFSGMHCELVEHKYVRFTVVLDSGLKTHLAKFGQAQMAQELYNALKDAISATESRGSATPTSVV